MQELNIRDRNRALRWLLLGAAFGQPSMSDVVPEIPLLPEARIEVRLAADHEVRYALSLPDDSATEVELIQQSGFIDLELQDGAGTQRSLRTEAGVDGHIEAPLLAATSTHWQLTISARKGRGAAAFSLRVSNIRPASAGDALRSEAFDRYVEAEQLRRANFRETVVSQRSEVIEERTRAAYTAAAARYGQAGDGCGERRALIGVARMEVALGNHASARKAAEAALSASCENDPAERAQALKTIGMAAAYQADFTASVDAAEQALAIYRQTGDLRYQGVVLGNLSDVYMSLGLTDRALAAADGALGAAEATNDGQGVIFSRKSMAAIELARGQLADALRDYRLMLDSLGRTPYPMIEGETWNDLGIVYQRMADYRESRKAFAMAQRVWKQMSYRAGIADTLINTGELSLELSQGSRAVGQFKAALELARADGLKSSQTRALRGLGAASLASGRLHEADGYFDASLRMAQASGEIAAESYALRGLGDVAFRRAQFTLARRRDEAALALARRAADRDGEAATLAQLARAAAAGGALDQAREAISGALAIIELQRGQINDLSLRTSYFSSMRAYADTEIDILMRLDARHPAAGFAVAALAAAEGARARSLQDMFAERSIEPSRGVPADLAAAERAAEEHLRSAALQVSRFSADAGSVRYHALENAVDAASRALDEARGRIRAANPRYADLVQPAPVNLREVQRSLPADDGAVLEYWLGTRQSYVWIVTRDSARAIRLSRKELIEGRAAAFSSLLRTPARELPNAGFEGLSVAESRRATAIASAGAQLAQLVMGPRVLHGLPRKIAIVADGGLQDVPFGTLPERHGEVLFGAEHDLFYVPSIGTFKWLRRSQDVAETVPALAIFAAPVLEIPTAPMAGGAAPLPYALVEANRISAMLPKERIWLAVGAEASRSNVLAADWRRYTIAHFATHAIIDRHHPELSSVVLSLYDSKGRAQDGMLRMNDIYDLDMPVDLVVLSGCDTAAGAALEAEGVFSLSRAFLYAGARQVVASLWPVEDRATAAFMTEFYRGLLVEHMHAATALRFAQQVLARDVRWASPYYWGGFVLQGDWN